MPANAAIPASSAIITTETVAHRRSTRAAMTSTAGSWPGVRCPIIERDARSREGPAWDEHEEVEGEPDRAPGARPRPRQGERAPRPGADARLDVALLRRACVGRESGVDHGACLSQSSGAERSSLASRAATAAPWLPQDVRM